MKISCIGIVHYSDGVVLVRDDPKAQWRLPQRELDDSEDVVLCIRRCVLMQTGYKISKLRLYKIQTIPRTPKRGAALKFIFGCEIGDTPIQTPDIEAQKFGPDDVVKLAVQEKFSDVMLLDIINKYDALAAPPKAHEWHTHPITSLQ